MSTTLRTFLSFFCISFGILEAVVAQHSVARDWNEEVLHAVRNDFARPTVHARNLLHSSILMYDAWAIFEAEAETVFLGQNFGEFPVSYQAIETPNDPNAATHEILSYAIYRLILHRFSESPGADEIVTAINALMDSYGYDTSITSTDYSAGNYAALGNYMAQQMIAFGLQDGSNESDEYENQVYEPSNEPLILDQYLDNDFINPDRWQPLAFDSFIDQGGNPIANAIPPFLSPEWGEVTPFALTENDREVLNNGFDCVVYKDPGAPVYIQNSTENGITDPYKWHFSLVAAWSSHLDPSDDTTIEIGPSDNGNFDASNLPETFEEFQQFYDYTNGGDPSEGHTENPATGEPYASQSVKRGDYTRVLAEFWADGPDSETPPGHWFTILNYVSDQETLEKKWAGEGAILSNLEWDVKTYLAMGGAMHDSAITAWGIKGYYDYLRPISAIRYMAAKGQSTDTALPNFDPQGLPLVENHIELITEGDPLAGDNDENVGQLKIRAWKGPDFITDPTTDIAGVDWILAKRWWPYQRGTFVTPPFAGYISGHSTFSRAAAEVLTAVTGDPFFPNGLGVFDIPADTFLAFEKGPSESFQLQWATYRDASDQSSLSRIWGGIHPPIDDIAGRLLGIEIADAAFAKTQAYFEEQLSTSTQENGNLASFYPNPSKDYIIIEPNQKGFDQVIIYDLLGRERLSKSLLPLENTSLDISSLAPSHYLITLHTNGQMQHSSLLIKE